MPGVTKRYHIGSKTGFQKIKKGFQQVKTGFHKIALDAAYLPYYISATPNTLT